LRNASTGRIDFQYALSLKFNSNTKSNTFNYWRLITMMTRWKAFSIHLTISAAIAVGVAVLMLWLWYTPAFFSAAGGQTLLLLLLGIDVTLGPLITLVIFNSKKSRKALTFDFSVIAMLQVAALLYGMNVMFQSRPVFVAYLTDSFALATADQISAADLAKSKYPDFQSLPLTGPVYVHAEMPTNANEKGDVELGTALGKGLQCFPQHYRPYSEHMKMAGQAAKPLAELKKLNEDRSTDIDKAVQSSGRSEADLGFLPLSGVDTNLAVLLGKSDGKIIEILQLRPF
jgi:hypothetical protein